MSTYPNLSVDYYEHYAVIGIEKKPANALTIQNCIDISKIIKELEEDDTIRVIIIASKIRFAFFTGSDLDEISEIMHRDGDPNKNMVDASRPVQEAFTSIENSKKVLIAAINGLTIGLGVELALVCDIRICSELAWFKTAQTSIGIIPGAGGTQRLPKTVGIGKAKEIIYTAKKVNAQEALQIGLVNQVVPSGKEFDAAAKMAESIINNTPVHAVRLAKQAINYGIYASTLQDGLDYEMDCLGETYDNPDSFEGIAAVMEKRKADFQNIEVNSKR